jgi:hypothetical protein
MPYLSPRSPRLVRLLARTFVILALPAILASGCKKANAGPGAPNPPAPPQPPPPVINTDNPTGSQLNLDARTSMRTPANTGTFMFDDFVSPTAATIVRVLWQGIYCAEIANQAAPNATATGFEVAFYPDSGGLPNTSSPIQKVMYAIGRTGENRDFAATANCGTASTGWSFYNYDLTLDTPFAAAAGVRYWVSIQAQVNYLQAGNPGFIFWGWRNGLPNNNRSVQINPAGAVTEFPLDRAYSLIQQ